MEKILKSSDLNLKEIKKILKQGGVLVYPTDTVYGICADFNSTEGIKKIYKVKERDERSPLIALLSDKKYLEKIAEIPNDKKEIIERVIEKFWPGALTIILKKKYVVPNEMVSNGESVGVRVPNLKITRDIIESMGGILPTTSANISGERTPQKYEELSKEIIERADIVVKYEEEILGVASTIVDFSKEKIAILREGAIKKEELNLLINKK